MPNKPGKIVIDTNLFISFLLTKDYTKLNNIIFSGKWKLIFSDELIQEIIEVAKRPRFRRFFSLSDIEELVLILYTHGSFVNIKTEVNVCRDLKDNFLLALAVDGNPSVLLTGDQDLLILEKYHNTQITTISDFIKQS
jgi:putative PIN family toxin of toxin-antitoxin system